MSYETLILCLRVFFIVSGSCTVISGIVVMGVFPVGLFVGVMTLVVGVLMITIGCRVEQYIPRSRYDQDFPS